MNILMMTTGLGCGGAEHQVVLLADNLKAAGHHVAIVSLTGHTIIKPTDPDIKIVELNIQKNPVSLVNAIYKCVKLIKAYQPDVVHSHMIHANLFARILRIFCNIRRLVCTAHSTHEGGVFRMFLYRVTDVLCDISTNVSRAAVERFVKLKATPAHKILPVYNAIDTKKFKFDQQLRETVRKRESVGGLLLLAVGRLTDAKDYPTLLNAFSIVNKNYPTIELWIVGDGPKKVELQGLAKTLGIDAQVRFMGMRHDILDLMCASDVFVLSSAWEGFGLVVAEAMACERTVVATDSGGTSEVIGCHGEIVAIKSPERLADALLLAIKKSDRPNLAGRNHVERCFSLKEIISRWESIYSR